MSTSASSQVAATKTGRRGHYREGTRQLTVRVPDSLYERLRMEAHAREKWAKRDDWPWTEAWVLVEVALEHYNLNDLRRDDTP